MLHPKGFLWAISATFLAHPLAGQSVLDRTPNLSGGSIAYPGLFFINVPFRFMSAGGGADGIIARPTLEAGMGLPRNVFAGARFAPESPTAPGKPDEWEVFVRHSPLSDSRGDALEVAITAGFNGAAESIDGEVSVARWLGPARLIGVVRGMTEGYGSDEARLAVGGGVVVHPMPGRAPIALAADVVTLTDQDQAEEVVWSAGVSLGIPYTSHTLALFATNSATGTLQGRSRGDEEVRYGLEVSIPIPVGRFLGWYADREVASGAVVAEPPQPGPLVHAAAIRFQFLPMQIEIPAGTTIEWTNEDDMVHTVGGDDGSWSSGGIPPGGVWRATFAEPGTYPFRCGPHPFMQGIVLVR